MARVFGLWNGGLGRYSDSHFYDDLESWPTLAAAKASLVSRYESRMADHRSVRVTFDSDDNAYVTLGENEGVETPNVGEDSTIDIYFGERTNMRRKGRRLWRVYGEPSLRLSLSFYEFKHDPERWREPKLRGVKVERY